MTKNVQAATKQYFEHESDIWRTAPISGFPSAFPGAYGFGALSVGGRSGTIYQVSNLNDSGSGSFREACEASGPRLVLFNVSGLINLQSALTVTNPYLTIAGQTSPGGILITGWPFRTNAHNMTIRHMRFRVGSQETTFHGGTADPDTQDAFQIWGPDTAAPHNSSHDIILDHCSIGWGIDECLDLAFNPYNITIQKTIVSEGFTAAGHSEGDHSKGLFVWNKFSPDITLTLYDNFVAHCRARTPEITGAGTHTARVEVIGNINFNYDGGIGQTSKDAIHINWIATYSRRGPGTNVSQHWEMLHIPELTVTPDNNVYVLDNRGLNDTVPPVPIEWRVGDSFGATLASEDWRAFSPWTMSAQPPPLQAEPTALSSNAKAITLGATVPVIDFVDQRAMDDFVASETTPTGSYVADVAYPGGFPVYATPSPPTDTNGDGIPDAYETSKGFTIGTMVPGDNAPSGYTWIEEYFNDLADGSYSN